MRKAKTAEADEVAKALFASRSPIKTQQLLLDRLRAGAAQLRRL
jgi:hypothetical protein